MHDRHKGVTFKTAETMEGETESGTTRIEGTSRVIAPCFKGIGDSADRRSKTLREIDRLCRVSYDRTGGRQRAVASPDCLKGN